MTDQKYIRQAIDLSKKSFDKGYFPAGSLVVQSGKILSTEISSPYPGHQHADSKAVDNAFENYGDKLVSATLYSSMEPCLMCISRAYWAGIRRIVFACSQTAVSREYFETGASIDKIVSAFNEDVELVHLKDFQSEAIQVVRKWEKKVKNGQHIT